MAHKRVALEPVIGFRGDGEWQDGSGNTLGTYDGDAGYWVIGTTVTGGGDVDSDTSSYGLALSATNNFGFAVYGSDGGTAHTAGWSSAIFGSHILHTAVASSPNISCFGVTGQFHISGVSVTTIGNMAGVYGIAECETGTTIGGPFFGGLFGATIPSGATLSASQYAGGIIIGGNYAGTTTGHVVAIYVQNPTSTANFDAFAALGQNAEYAGCVTAAAVGGSQTHKIKFLVGGTLMYVPLHTA